MAKSNMTNRNKPKASSFTYGEERQLRQAQKYRDGHNNHQGGYLECRASRVSNGVAVSLCGGRECGPRQNCCVPMAEPEKVVRIIFWRISWASNT